ncbi:PilT protein domain protein [Turneriella parva DSM 21527]|uniref:Ribonuclease VapC n=1 Tax=Turneriella parva (strain ATCC BAA-1111 / DSM 21527 / NCTC 11395 / H) TaxID=869212 RepID=I4BA42_TURPD|nr:PilT protein domain protein [Turneriella parva DSM 21527]
MLRFQTFSPLRKLKNGSLKIFLLLKGYGKNEKLPAKSFGNWLGIVVIVDTDVMVEFLRDSADAAKALRVIKAENLAISAVTRMELLVGAWNNAELRKIEKALDAIQEFAISEDISTKAVDLIRKYAKSHGLKIPDAIIAATAMDQSFQLFTYNVRDFKFIKGLTLYSV